MANETKVNELSNKTLTRYAMSADNDVQKRRSNRPAGKGDESDPKIGKRLSSINLAHKKGAFKKESVDLDEDLTHQTVKPPNHTKKYSSNDYRDTNSIGGGGTKRHTVTSSQADAHDKTAAHHDNVADAHTKASEKSSSFKIRSLHSKAARLHRNAAEAHRDSSHSSSGADNDGSIQKTAKHMHTAYHATMAANDSSKQARNMGTKTKRMNKEEVDQSVLPPVYARILEEREKHYKGATKPEGMMDNSKSSKGAMDMVNLPKEINDDDEKGHEDASKAGRVGPSAKARPADNMKGDKKVIPSATPMKGK